MTRFLVAVALLAFLGGGATALAHATPVKTVPEMDARLARPPTEVRITFSERPEPPFSEIQVLDPLGKRVDLGDLSTVDELTLRVGLTALGEGGYVVAWRVLSAVDGHETRGSFVFAVGNAPLPALPDIEYAPPPSGPELAARFLSFGGVALLIGVPFFSLAVARAERDRAGLRGLIRAGAILLLAGTLALFALSGGTSLLDSRLGRVLEARAVFAALALLPLPALAALASAAGAAATLTLQSHAAADNLLSMGLDLVHILAMGAWVGGLVALVTVVLPRRAVRETGEARDLGALVGRFSTLGLAAVATIVASGVLQSLRRLVDVRDLLETPYGLALLAKIALLAVAAGLAALNLLRHGPRLRIGARHESARVRDLLVLGLRGEVAAVALILVATSALTALVPPATPTGAAYAAVQHAAGLRVELLVQSVFPGQNRYVVRLQEGLRPPSDIEKVSLRFTMVEHDMGEQEIEARRRAAGEYVAEGSPTAMFGTWRTLVIVRRTDREEARALFTVPITGTGEGGLRTRIVQAGQLTLIVFTQPALPVAGQPLTLYVVAVDQTGNPIRDAGLRVELEGQTYPAVPEEGVRYRTELPALTAGNKQLTLVVTTPAGEMRGVYDVSVAP